MKTIKYLLFFLFTLTCIGCDSATVKIELENPRGEVLIERSPECRLSLTCKFRKPVGRIRPALIADMMARKALFKYLRATDEQQLLIRGMVMAKEPVEDSPFVIYFYEVNEADCTIQPKEKH